MIIHYLTTDRMIFPKYYFLATSLLGCLCSVSLASFHLTSGDVNEVIQKPLSSDTNFWVNTNFSVGFSLQSSYGSVAIIFDGFNGERKTYTRVLQGDYFYKEVMARLSLESSMHRAPPYENNGDWVADQPRRGAREALKSIGLPATYDVGILSNVVKRLKSQVESEFGITVSEAVFTCTHLLALYSDDLEEAAFDARIKSVRPLYQYRPILWETATAYAGNGLGLCKHPERSDECEDEEMSWPRISILAIHYSTNALTVSLARVSDAITTWEPNYRHLENFTLGSDAIASYSNAENYWADVKEALLDTMTSFPGFPRPVKIMLTGDMVEENFLEFSRKTMVDYLGYFPFLLADDPMVVSAKGQRNLCGDHHTLSLILPNDD